MQEHLIAAWRPAFALAAALTALPAGAIILGDVEVRSALGESLDARIPVANPDGELVDASCFSLGREGGAEGLPAVVEGILTVERTGDAPVLRVRSLRRIYEPAVMLRVRASCPGAPGYVMRQYSLLLDPRPGTDVIPSLPVTQAQTRRAEPDAATEMSSQAAGASVASLRARQGDSLASIASTVFPRDRGARVQYLAALRAANPAYAAQADSEAIPEGAPIVLPDLRTFARAAVDASRAATAARPQDARERRAAQPARERDSARAAAAEPRRATREAGAARASREPAFVLKLSSAEVDLSRSRAIDDRVRQQLRERLLVLDSDDQVSALLSMRNSLRQLENRVNELQLKLAAMPASLAGARPPIISRTDAPAMAQMEAPVSVPRVETTPAPTSAVPEPAAPAVPAAPTATTSAPPPEAAKAVEPAQVAAEPEKAAAGVPRPKPATRTESTRVLEPTPWLWGLVAAMIGLAILLAWRLHRRRRQQEEYEYVEPQIGEADQTVALEESIPELSHEEVRAVVASDAELPTRIPDDSAALRRRYIEERFPEVASRAIVLEDPDSVVKAARLYYEDGAITRAIELLRFAIDENPDEVRPWLALFEIFRLERLDGQFAELATRFREHHEASGYWRKVQFIGRELDPANPLYHDEAFDSLETIGPAAARRRNVASFDPLAENWLAAPAERQERGLAAELRRSLMTDHGIDEKDLAPNPKTALRNAETFTLA